MGSLPVRGESGRLTVRALSVVLGLLTACALVAWGFDALVVRHVREWDVDAQGPVLVSTDGRTLILWGVPDPAWRSGDCFGNLGVTVLTGVHGGDVTVRFHLRSVPQDSGGPMGTCAPYSGIRATLDQPLGSRALTDGHGHPLRTVLEAALPRPRGSTMVEDAPGLCVARLQNLTNSCLGSVTLVRYFRDAPGQSLWKLYQSLDVSTVEPPSTEPLLGPERGTVNGAPAVCGGIAGDGTEVDWLWAGTAQRLVLPLSRNDPRAPDRPCALAFADAQTVR